MGKIGPVRRRDENELEQSPAKRDRSGSIMRISEIGLAGVND